MLNGTHRIAFGLTEPDHGSDATWMETRAVPETRDGVDGWLINGEKMWNTGMHVANYDMIFARTSGDDGAARGISCFLVPTDAEGFKIEEYLWTFNMTTDHPRISLTNVWVPDSAIFGPRDGGLALAQHFVHENRIRQAASGVGAAQYCINESVAYAKHRKPFGKPLAANQAIHPTDRIAHRMREIRNLVINGGAKHNSKRKSRLICRIKSPCELSRQSAICEAADRATCCGRLFAP